MKRYCILSATAVLLLSSAEAQGQGRADWQSTRRSNATTWKPIPKKEKPAEVSTTA
jgi:hypothetical protein